MVALEMAMTSAKPCSEPRIKVTSALSMATSVPEPMAKPTSAWANAGASLMPSPVMPTISPSACKAFTLSDLCSGSTSANTSSIPTCLATARAVVSLSPVIITNRKPCRCSRRIASTESSLMGSATAMAANSLEALAKYISVQPCSAMSPDNVFICSSLMSA